MPHVLVAGRIHDAGLALLRATPNLTFDLVEEVSTESYAPLVAHADAVLIRTQPMPASIINAAPRLKIVSRHGVGYDSVDVEALNERGIPLAIVGDVNSRSVAEHTMMLILSMAKRTLTYDAKTRDAEWNYRNSFDATELADKTLLLLGFGRIGRSVAKLAEAFGMKIMVHDPFVDETLIKDAGAVAVLDLSSALTQADVISVHIPLSTGRALIGAPELAKLKPTAVVVNTARGGLVDEDALATAIEEGRVAGAGLDVFNAEPPPHDHPLFKSDRVILSPHSAGLTRESAIRMSVSAVQNILDFFAGSLDPSIVVNAASVSPSARELMRA
jgi:D-3-phosphoglycerate dehydrogenase / 2-oxoglutarate reductase